MSDTTAKLDRRTDLKNNRRALRGLFLWISLLLLFSFAGRSAAEAADIHGGPVTSVGPGPQFAIADFDGDRRPDLARIQAWPNSSGSTDYRIQLELSAVGRQSIQIRAPAGGLLIEARDFNGDGAVDLVLATAWSRQRVAVLLNDGHGYFSRVEPSAFPGAFSESKTNWGSGPNQATDAVGVPLRSQDSVSPEARSLLGARSPAAPIPFSSAGSPFNPFLTSHSGRAPPSETPRF